MRKNKTYVIGDIHGSYWQLYILLDALDLYRDDKIVFMGDYIDRGHQSKQVIEKLLDIKEKFPNTVFLRGNHEDMFLHYLGRRGSYGNMFMYNGGWKTLLSYSIDLPMLERFEELSYDEQNDLILEWKAYSDDDLVAAISEEHIQFIENTVLYHDTEKVLYVHGGVDSRLPLEEQSTFEFLWASDRRDAFFCRMRDKPWEKMVIHGHTITSPDSVKRDGPNRINVDTGVILKKGKLTCLIIDESTPWNDWEIVQVDRLLRVTRGK